MPELEPVLEALDGCLETTKGLRGAEAKAFRDQLSELREFAGMADKVMEVVARRDARMVLKFATRFLA